MDMMSKTCEEAPMVCTPKQLTLTERLQQEESLLSRRLGDVRDALLQLQNAPEVQAAVDAIAKVGHLR
jgi:hypothetical protein